MRPPARWQPWHKAVLGALGVVTLGLCAIVIFAPDTGSGPATYPGGSAAAAVRQAATVDADESPARTATTATGQKPGTTPVASKSAKPSATTRGPDATKTPPKTPVTVHYADCDAAPGELASGDPGYRAGLDRDGDGIACESNGDDHVPVETEEPATGTDPRFDTCAKANAAGYGPYVRGTDPEYDWYIDRDSDGIACER
ncbi:hypothetical protein Ait01nite_039960 [Actinoplanes italicus]|uniref:Excalibur calcium-binding domain-containing protein n=1 Tax=Actinoplanes italicus TaxID=113567 RepID=A0A2T0JWX7_9ACTN|nr:excalibur calcium-binding domain-containing protein [Actinoplanes italicus]PRX11980.1 excalibur calcium-binding domain-containing protein [Actinoplanes italicus]GIE30951.1 hypothetical protein Ait01nite_039960 [Actinoplanes italicus]